MAEGIPYTPNGAESFTPDTNSEEKKKKRKRRSGAGGLGALASGSAERQAAQEKSKKERQPTPIKGLFELASDTDTTEQKSNKAESAEINQAVQSEVDARVIEDEHTTSEAEAIISRELSPDEFNGGEVIINLRGRPEDEALPAEQPTMVEAIEEAQAPEAQSTIEDEPLPEAANPEEETSEPPEAAPVFTLAPEQVLVPQEEEEITKTTHPPAPTQPASSGGGAGGGRGRTPPAPTPGPSSSGGGNVPPVPYVYQQHAVQQNANVLPTAQASSPNTANVQQAIDDAEYYGRRKGRSEGFWTGALLVGGYEHFKHRRRERRMKKEFAQERDAHEKTVEDMKWDSIRKEQAEKWRAAEAEKFRRPEATPGAATAEKAPEAPKPAEVNPDQPEAEQLLKVPEGHRVERSAWHAVEVDSRGHAVEDSVINYGREYYKERAKESTPIDKVQLSNVTGGVALTAAAMQDIDEADESEEAAVSRQNRDLAEHGKSAAHTQGSLKKAAQSLGSPTDSPLSLLPWVILLIIIGAIVWWLSA